VVSSPRSGTKSTKDESSEETPRTNVKRKRSSGKENVCPFPFEFLNYDSGTSMIYF